MMHELGRVLSQHQEDLLWKANVVGCGIALKETNGVRTTQPCVTVFVVRKLPIHQLPASECVPPMLGSFPTDVVEVGVLRSLNIRTRRIRPAPPGVSIAHYRVSAGTFGAVVYDRNTNEPLILSNNHVLANETTGNDGRAQIGDPIYQPGPYDGGTATDLIATLTRYVPLRFPPPRVNLVDAAIAKPLETSLIKPEILGIGLVSGVGRVEVGEVVAKSGRSTGVTNGEVRAVNATVNILMSEGRTGRFDNQIVCSPMGDSGDSGSVGVKADNRVFGLLFAGSSSATIYNRIDLVLDTLGVDILL